MGQDLSPWLSLLANAGSWLLLGSGSVVLVLSAGAILRMPTFFTRIHAAAVNETLGAGLILTGLMLQTGARWDIAVKLVLVLVFLVITGPVASHSLARAALAAGIETGEYRRRQEQNQRDSSREEETAS
jgi:multicomponent Na+:H+ antiporter subunit G